MMIGQNWLHVGTGQSAAQGAVKWEGSMRGSGGGGLQWARTGYGHWVCRSDTGGAVQGQCNVGVKAGRGQGSKRCITCTT